MDSMQHGPYYEVTGGRDFNLLNLIAEKMNFQYEYLDPPERTQGATSESVDNITFSGALGMIQRRVTFVFFCK